MRRQRTEVSGTVAVEALTRGRRRLKISFEVKSLAGELELLRLIDGTTHEPEPITASEAASCCHRGRA